MASSSPSPIDRLKSRLMAPEVKARPSKTYLQSMLIADIARLSDCPAAADIASNTHQNATHFDSHVYYGVDIDAEALRIGLDGHGPGTDTEYIVGSVGQDELDRHLSTDGSGCCVSVEGDIRERLFPSSALDLIVSTHTLNHLDQQYHHEVIDHFCSYLRPGGHLLVQFSEKAWYTDRIRDTLEREFATVETDEYNTFLSSWYERIVADDKRVVFPDTVGLGRCKFALMAMAAIAISKFERLPLLGGKSVYVLALGKRE